MAGAWRAKIEGVFPQRKPVGNVGEHDILPPGDEGLRRRQAG
jgi:hypothetical protein